jgi:predicted DNA-binding protein
MSKAREVDEGFMVVVTAKLPVELHARLLGECERDTRSKSAVIRLALEMYLGEGKGRK